MTIGARPGRALQHPVHVAGAARNLGVLPEQGETGLCVIEAGGRGHGSLRGVPCRYGGADQRTQPQKTDENKNYCLETVERSAVAKLAWRASLRNGQIPLKESKESFASIGAGPVNPQ